MSERRVGFPHPSTVRCQDMLQAQAGYDSAGKLSGQFVQVALDGTVTPAFEFSS